MKRDVQNEKKAKIVIAKEQSEVVEKQEAKGELLKAYMETQVKYKEATSKVPKKGILIILPQGSVLPDIQYFVQYTW